MRSAIATFILICLLGAFISAGVWQLNRAGQKHSLIAAFSAGTAVDAVETLVDDTDAADYRFRRLELRGRFDSERHILLDNIVMAGRPGYHVLTPFYTGGQTVIVNRGWIPANPDRSVLPQISVDDNERDIATRLNRFPVPGMRLDLPQEFFTTWPRRMLFPTQEDISRALGEPVPVYQLLLDSDMPDGYARDWKPVEVGPEKHYGYAFQWFAFALLVLVLYILLNIRWNREYKQSLQQQSMNSNNGSGNNE